MRQLPKVYNESLKEERIREKEKEKKEKDKNQKKNLKNAVNDESYEDDGIDLDI